MFISDTSEDNMDKAFSGLIVESSWFICLLLELSMTFQLGDACFLSQLKSSTLSK